MELFHYESQAPTPVDASSTQCTRRYLEACSLLFERGLLCHSKITSESSEVLENIEKGLFFPSGLTI